MSILHLVKAVIALPLCALTFHAISWFGLSTPVWKMTQFVLCFFCVNGPPSFMSSPNFNNALLAFVTRLLAKTLVKIVPKTESWGKMFSIFLSKDGDLSPKLLFPFPLWQAVYPVRDNLNIFWLVCWFRTQHVTEALAEDILKNQLFYQRKIAK